MNFFLLKLALIKNIFGKLTKRYQRSAYYYYGDGTHSLSDLNRRPRRRRDPNSLTDLDNTLPGTYQPKSAQDHELVVVTDLKHEEEIRDRVRHFASQRSSAHSQPPKSPAKAHDILASG